MAKNEKQTPENEAETAQDQQVEQEQLQEETLEEAAPIDSTEEDLAAMKDKYLRLYAEFDNYKKRTSRERLELLKTAASSTIAKMLPVMDDFDRAKKAAEEDDNIEPLSEGVMLVYNKFLGALNACGVKPMETNGETFDPELHNAITEIPAPSEELKGKIVDTIEKGYYLHDKIVRHAKVVLGK